MHSQWWFSNDPPGTLKSATVAEATQSISGTYDVECTCALQGFRDVIPPIAAEPGWTLLRTAGGSAP